MADQNRTLNMFQFFDVIRLLDHCIILLSRVTRRSPDNQLYAEMLVDVRSLRRQVNDEYQDLKAEIIPGQEIDRN